MFTPYNRNGRAMGRPMQSGSNWGQPMQGMQNKQPPTQSAMAPAEQKKIAAPAKEDAAVFSVPTPKNREIDENLIPEMMPAKGFMTDSLGRPIPNDNNSLTVGADGRVLLEDVHFIDKMAHFDRERIPERVVHAKGAGAFGHFRVSASMAAYTTADFLQREGQQTKMFTRFSTVIGGRGSADTVRDPRGFATKFYTKQGIYDIVGNDLPVFFIRDAIKFPDVIHSLKPEPNSNLRDPQRFWDFVSLTPEATHMITWLYSDRGTISDYRHIEGFGVNTYVWVNSESVRHLVKYHWKPVQGLKSIDRFEAERLSGSDPDIATRLLYDAIARGDYPKYELFVQLMTPEEGERLSFDPLDDTKTWPEDVFPLRRVGVMTLDKNPQSFFAEVEQAAFCPANVVPGVELSADKMLQGRSFSYLDTQRHRLGPNFMQLPVNRSISPVVNNQRDGAMNYTFNPSPINYSPNSLAENNPRPAEIFVPKPNYAKGEIGRFPIKKTDDFTQAGERYRLLGERDRAHLCDNIAVELWKCKADIIKRVLSYFEQADAAFAAGVKRDMAKYKNA
ncbi:MAG: catalase [Oscillospiraceae bacterium]